MQSAVSHHCISAMQNSGCGGGRGVRGGHGRGRGGRGGRNGCNSGRGRGRGGRGHRN